MQENKPTSLAITAIILLSMFHITLIIEFFTFILTLIGWKNSLDIFYYWIDYTVPITFLNSFISSIRAEGDLFKVQETKWASDDSLLVSISTASIIFSLIIILVVNLFMSGSENEGIVVLIIGGIVMFFPIIALFMVINMGISFFTNWIYNTLFEKHLK